MPNSLVIRIPRTRFVIGILCALIMLFPTGAGADTSSMGDGNDAEGPMDIKSITQGHRRRQLDEVGQYQRLLVHEFETYEAWPSSE
jgi:hypothetical protein